MRVRRCEFPEALRLVASVLGGLTPYSYGSFFGPAPVSRPARVDRSALAFRFQLAALDRRIRAERIIEIAKEIDVSVLNDQDLDRALWCVAQAHTDVKRAELFEHVADEIRRRDFAERRSLEQAPHAA
jgi:hypothetical protein